MSIEAVQNTNTNQKLQKTAKVAAVGAGVSVLLNGAGGVMAQKAALKQGDAYVKNIEAQVAKQRKFATAFFCGTEEAAINMNKQLDQVIENAKEFISKGKVQYGQIAKTTAKYAAIAGLIWGGIYFVGKTIKDIVTKEK